MRRLAFQIPARSGRRTWAPAAGLALLAAGLLALQGQHSPAVQSQDMADRNLIKSVRPAPAGNTGARAPDFGPVPPGPRFWPDPEQYR